MKTFLLQNFDKLLLFVLVILLVTMVMHMAHSNMTESIISWGRELVSTVIGALIGLITGINITKTYGTTPEVGTTNVSSTVTTNSSKHETGKIE